MKTLLIYELTLEETRFYLLPDCPDWLERCHGFYGGTCDADDAGVDKDLEHLTLTLGGPWEQYRLSGWERQPIDGTEIRRIIHSGWVL
jgi:hypothetical protein